MSEGKKNKVKAGSKKGLVKNLWSYLFSREIFVFVREEDKKPKL